MMRISDAELNYWGDLYCEQELSRYLTFATFIHSPKMHLRRIFAKDHLPRGRQRDLIDALQELEQLADEHAARQRALRRLSGGAHA
jgi:hypothetical protein